VYRILVALAARMQFTSTGPLFYFPVKTGRGERQPNREERKEGRKVRKKDSCVDSRGEMSSLSMKKVATEADADKDMGPDKKPSCCISCQRGFVGGMERSFYRYGEFAAK
jgi:hypothetical protein